MSPSDTPNGRPANRRPVNTPTTTRSARRGVRHRPVPHSTLVPSGSGVNPESATSLRGAGGAMSWMRESAGKRRRTTALLCRCRSGRDSGGALPAAATVLLRSARSPVEPAGERGQAARKPATTDRAFRTRRRSGRPNPAPGATIHVRSELTYVATGPCDPEPGPIPGPRTDPTGQTTWPAYRIAGLPAPSARGSQGLGATSIAPVGTPLSTQSQSWGCGIHTEEFILDGDYVAPRARAATPSPGSTTASSRT